MGRGLWGCCFFGEDCEEGEKTSGHHEMTERVPGGDWFKRKGPLSFMKNV